jgi:hypothetical protein
MQLRPINFKITKYLRFPFTSQNICMLKKGATINDILSCINELSSIWLFENISKKSIAK